MKIKDENIEYLFKCIASLEGIEDTRSFLIDLCSMSELEEMSRRIKAARMLRDGCVYAEIAAETGLSTATISRVNRAIKYGNNGYTKVLENIKNTENQ